MTRTRVKVGAKVFLNPNMNPYEKVRYLLVNKTTENRKRTKYQTPLWTRILVWLSAFPSINFPCQPNQN